MKSKNNIGFIEYFAIIASVLFIFGCIASSYKSAKTLEPKQVAFGAGYMHLENLDNSEADGIDLLDLNFRVGISKGVDMGLAHTFDISSESGNTSLSTFWWDFKTQLSNRENEIGNVSFSLGFIKAYTYDPEIHITSIPLLISVPASENITPTFQYRIAFVSSDFFPSSFEDPRHELALGMEYSFYKTLSDKWNPKIGFAVGWFNSLTGGEGDSGLILNLGITVESPVSY